LDNTLEAANIKADWWTQIGVEAKVDEVYAGTLASIIRPNITQDIEL
jgi:hypothetical protein